MAKLNVDEDQLLAINSFDRKVQQNKTKEQRKQFDEEGSGLIGSGQNVEF
jgi:hypothetical protein